MKTLLYIANARLPTEKANGYQIVQMCEAFALEGLRVKLVAPRRVNTPELKKIDNIWDHYGVRHNFEIVYLPCIDLMWLPYFVKFWFFLQTLTYLIAVMIWLLFQSYDYIFSRDQFIMAVLVLIKLRHQLIYEVHSRARSRRAQRLQSWVLRRVGLVVSMTGAMAAQLQQTGAQHVITAHDGIRPERFQQLNQQAIRKDLGIDPDAFVACYAGRLHTMGMSKGLDHFIKAVTHSQELILFLLVGGPPENVADLRQQWQQEGLSPENFIAVGTVVPMEVPRYLVAADVCVIPSPHNEFFANETSPMKLFEYMMAGKAILASDLPSTREVVQHLISAYLVPPSDTKALAEALHTLKADSDLRRKLGEQAARDVLQYTWQHRAALILSSIPISDPDPST